ncbi:MAG TPA: phosphopantetheine-binding protein [Pseudomonadales bacterium]|jgi:acyl carrier protein|nr:acyl carrier protein [Cellvibrionales bacterium]HRF87084.1 phosphopantetheine-binding protein [Pseudomonadales bacterium]HRG50016.1 phosphopantetheine-binding protein [Pseudomonadales bacterium]
MIDRDTLKKALKQLIVVECDKDIAPETIADDAVLIGGDLALDSLDALQIAMAIKTQYGVRIEDGPSARRAMQSINALADTILNYQAD